MPSGRGPVHFPAPCPQAESAAHKEEAAHLALEQMWPDILGWRLGTLGNDSYNART